MVPGQMTIKEIQDQSSMTAIGKYSNSKSSEEDLKIIFKRRRVQGSKERMWFVKPKSKNFIGQNLNILDYYLQGIELGRGSYGVVNRCCDNITFEMFACKSVMKNHVKFDMNNLQMEVAIMEHLYPHPNIVALKAAYDDDIAVHLVMELCEGGDLADHIDDIGHYTEQGAVAVMRTVMEVVQMCHMNGVIHRDLKLDNFVFLNAYEDSPLKAIDFGMSVFFKPGERFSQVIGSIPYMAPEIFNRDYGPEVDIWSAGVILYMLLCGEFPFQGETRMEVEQEVLHSNLDLCSHAWKKVSPCAKSLVRHMLDCNPKVRYTAEQVLDHEWLRMQPEIETEMSKHTIRRRTI